MERCNNTSVGVVVVSTNRLLMIERARPPYGWALPAGHVDTGETHRSAAARELREEVGLVVDPYRLRYLTSSQVDNRCRRPGGDWHYWEVYEAPGSAVVGEPRYSEETACVEWVGFHRLEELLGLSAQHVMSGAGAEVWRARPGLEPVWQQLMTDMGMLTVAAPGGRLQINPAWFYVRRP